MPIFEAWDRELRIRARRSDTPCTSSRQSVRRGGLIDRGIRRTRGTAIPAAFYLRFLLSDAGWFDLACWPFPSEAEVLR